MLISLHSEVFYIPQRIFLIPATHLLQDRKILYFQVTALNFTEKFTAWEQFLDLAAVNHKITQSAVTQNLI